MAGANEFIKHCGTFVSRTVPLSQSQPMPPVIILTTISSAQQSQVWLLCGSQQLLWSSCSVITDLAIDVPVEITMGRGWFLPCAEPVLPFP